MDTSEALKIVRNMKGHFRAFEQAEEVLQTLANSQSVIGELDRKAKSLRKEIDGLEDQKRLAENSIIATREANAKERARLDAELQEHRKAVEERTRKMTRAFKDEEATFQAQRKEALQAFETEKKVLAHDVTSLRQAREAVQRDLDELRAKVGRL